MLLTKEKTIVLQIY